MRLNESVGYSQVISLNIKAGSVLLKYVFLRVSLVFEDRARLAERTKVRSDSPRQLPFKYKGRMLKLLLVLLCKTLLKLRKPQAAMGLIQGGFR